MTKDTSMVETREGECNQMVAGQLVDHRNGGGSQLRGIGVLRRMKWILLVVSVFVVGVFVWIEVHNKFQLTERVSASFWVDMSECDEVDQKGASGFVSHFFRQFGLVNTVNVYLTVTNLVSPAAMPLPDNLTQAVTSQEPDTPAPKVVVRNIPGLDRIVGRMIASYEKSDFTNAMDYAHVGLEMITPVLTPYLSKSFAVETRFARNASAVYTMIAEEAWARRDFKEAQTNVQYAAKLSGSRPQPELLAMMAAIHFDEAGEAVDVFPPKVMQALRDIEKGMKEGGDDFLYRYLNVLAMTGFIQPILTDDQGKGWYLDLQRYFGFKKRLETRGVIDNDFMNTKDGSRFTDGLFMTIRHAGLGKSNMVASPDNEGRELPMDFDTEKYRLKTTKPVSCPIRLYKKK